MFYEHKHFRKKVVSMKKALILFLVICSLCFFSLYNASAESHFDSYAKDKEVITITDPPFTLFEAESAADVFFGDSKNLPLTMLGLWLNLTNGEECNGKPVKDTLGAEIVRNMESGFYLISCTAESSDSNLVNLVIGTSSSESEYGKAYWIEWNLSTQVIRAMDAYGICVPNITSGYQISEDYYYKSWFLASQGGDLLKVKSPAGTALEQGLASDDYDMASAMRRLYEQNLGYSADF